MEEFGGGGGGSSPPPERSLITQTDSARSALYQRIAQFKMAADPHQLKSYLARSLPIPKGSFFPIGVPFSPFVRLVVVSNTLFCFCSLSVRPLVPGRKKVRPCSDSGGREGGLSPI